MSKIFQVVVGAAVCCHVSNAIQVESRFDKIWSKIKKNNWNFADKFANDVDVRTADSAGQQRPAYRYDAMADVRFFFEQNHFQTFAFSNFYISQIFYRCG